MARLNWGKPGSRTYQNGVDQGVIYLFGNDGAGIGVPWSGLTAVDEKPERDTSPVYYDGRKISDGVTIGDFSATLSAVVYPDELEALEGGTKLRRGVLINDQPAQPFALCYRTMINDEVARDSIGYKIHVIWNVTAIPNEKNFASISDQPEIAEFQWDLVAVPEELPGMRPTAHITIDTRKLDPWLLEEIERILYGNSMAEASLVPMADFFAFLRDWYRIRIVDNGNGTWTAIEIRPGFISVNDESDIFTIIKANAVFLDDNTYVIADTEFDDINLIDVVDNGDGTWTAQTDNDAVIEIAPDGSFVIHAMDVVFAGPEMYRISSQTSPH